MSKKKKIPCRVCGKLFVPCAYCQSNTDAFRWRNFACSMKCARKYIEDTNTYRANLHKQKETVDKDDKTIAKNIVSIKGKTDKTDSVENIERAIVKNTKTE